MTALTDSLTKALDQSSKTETTQTPGADIGAPIADGHLLPFAKNPPRPVGTPGSPEADVDGGAPV